MSHLLKYTEWESGSGRRWYCNDVQDLAGVSGEWWVPARMLGLTPAAYVKMLVEDFHVDNLSFDGKTLVYSWNDQSKMRKFKNWLNAEARRRNFQV